MKPIYSTQHIIHVDFKEIVFDFTQNAEGQYVHQVDKNEKVVAVSSPQPTTIGGADYFIEQGGIEDVDANHKWYFDNDNSVLYFMDSDPKESFSDSGTFIIVTKRMYFSDFSDLYLPEKIGDSTSKTRLYKNRIIESPKVDEDISSNYFGILSVSVSKISLNNADGFFEKRMEKTVTFNGGSVTVFRRDSVKDTFKPLAKAPIRNLKINRETASLELSDLSLGLDSPYNRLSGINPDGDNVTWDSWLVVSSNTPSILSDHVDKPVVDIVGQFSPCPALNSNVASSIVNLEFTEQNSLTSKSYILDYRELVSCANIDDAGSASSTNNRKWGVCTMSSSSENIQKDFTMVDDSAQSSTRIDLSLFNQFQEVLNYITPGEWCLVYPGSGGTTYFTKCVQHYNGSLYFEPRIPAPDGDDSSFTATITFFSVPVVFVQQNGEAYEISPDHYSIDAVNSAEFDFQNQRFFTITFDDDFESSISGLSTIEPNTEVTARCRNVENATQGVVDYVQSLLQQRGVSINTSSFSDFKQNYNPAIALKYESDMSYKEMIELALESFFGYLYFDNSGDISIDNHQFNRDTKNMGTDIIFLGTESIDMAYPDIFTSIVVTHENFQQKSFGLGLKLKLSCNEAIVFFDTSAVRNMRTMLAPTAWARYSAGAPLTTYNPETANDESLIFDTSVLIDYLKNQTLNYFVMTFEGSGVARNFKVGDTIDIVDQRGRFKGARIKSSYKSSQDISSSVEGYGFEQQSATSDDFTVQTSYPWKSDGSRIIHTI